MTEGASDAPCLPADVLISIFGFLSSHERRAIVPLVCKSWWQAVLSSCACEELWSEVDISDIPTSAQRSASGACAALGTRESVIRQWLLDRRGVLASLRVHLAAQTSVGEKARSPLADWVQAFGQALPALAPSSVLSRISLHGPGVDAANAATTVGIPSPTEASCALVNGAFSLPSLKALHIYDVPWAGALHLSPAGTILANLRELVIHRCFYHAGAGSAEPLSADTAADATAEAWADLGRALADRCPLLERLDLAHTDAMTYIDPARGAVTAPWPPMPRLRELSLAHDLSVQPPPPPPRPSRSATPEVADLDPVNAAAGFSARAEVGAAGHEAAEGGACAAAAMGVAGGAVGVPANAALWDDLLGTAGGAGGSDEPAPDAAGAFSTTTMAGADDDDDDVGHMEMALEELLRDEAWEPQLQHDQQEEGGEEGAVFGPPVLTVDAAHAAVELLTWLPGCASLTSLDLRRCGLEAVPLAVTHLPHLARLDLQGNPLVSMRLPGPLPRLTWLRFSLDPCYDMLAEALAAQAGEAAAAEEAWLVELPAPQLQELEVDASSEVALRLLREAASALEHLRRLALVHNDTALY